MPHPDDVKHWLRDRAIAKDNIGDFQSADMLTAALKLIEKLEREIRCAGGAPHK